MRLPSRLLSASLAATLLVAQARADDVPLNGDKAAAAEVLRTFQAWTRAYAAGDMAGVMAIFDPDVLFEFQGGKDERLDDLRRDYETDFKTRAPGTTWQPRLEEVRAQGELAFVRSTWELHVAGQGEGAADTVKHRNRSVDILGRQDGRWRILRSFNYPEKLR